MGKGRGGATKVLFGHGAAAIRGGDPARRAQWRARGACVTRIGTQGRGLAARRVLRRMRRLGRWGGVGGTHKEGKGID